MTNQDTCEAGEAEPESASDKELALAAAQGDAEAFTELVSRHYDRCYRLAWRWCGSQTEAEDIAQEVCVKIAQSIRSWRGDAAFSTWAYRIVYTTTIDHLRARQRLQLVEPSELTLLAERSSGPTGAPGKDPHGAEVHLLYGELWDEVRRLPGQQRDAVLLVYGEDMSHAEAAVIMGCSEKTVSWHLHEAKKRLRTTLEAAG
ncbi:MAG: RNA polymerase sigma factor [Hyphomicrobiaceae bacterium]